MTGATLKDANLSGAILEGTFLTNATLSGANLSGADLTGAILKRADLRECILYKAILVDAIMVEADLRKAYLNQAFLQGVNLSHAKLANANFRGADLSRAKLIKANMTNADLSAALLQDVDLTQAVSKKTNLTKANLTEATLTGAKLNGAILKKATLSATILKGANFNGVSLSQTIFENVDLRETKGLETAVHDEPSAIDIDTIYRSRSNIPIEFLRSAGIPDIIIDSMLVNANHPMKFHTCFISYSSKDEVFTNRLVTDLRHLGVHCWFAPENMIIGEDFEKRIDNSIRDTDKLVVILSEHSIRSSWVEKEAKAASQLLPIQIDKAIQTTDQDWAVDIRSSNHIGDFISWQQPHAYLLALALLLSALKADS
jgi:uncharacterized protein YjbI with pentapeptide repeats